MADYNKATNFTAKDGLPTGNAGKIIKGTEIDTEFTAIASAIASKADINSPSLTGTPTAPTASLGTNTTQLATTAFVTAGLANLVPTGVITLWSGSIAAIPSGWLLCNGANSTPDLRDRFVVGAGTTYAVGATGGANTVTLDSTMIPSHTHSISASGTTSEVNLSHTHSLSASGTTSGHSTDHTHSGTTSAVSNDHNHTFSGSTGAMSANAAHSHGITDPGHAHNIDTFANNVGITGTTPYVAGSDARTSVTNSAVTGISVNSANIDHTHAYSGTTSGISANHTHTITTSGVSTDHTHTVTVTGTSGAMSANATHTHTVTVTGTSGSFGSGSSHENRPPYYALAYIMKS
jgi:microcystin-dependent protein